MKRQIHIDKIKLDRFIAMLGGFAEEQTKPSLNDRIRALWLAGHTFREIAWRVDLVEDAVRMRASRMKLIRQHQRAWESWEIRLLFELRDAGNTWEKIGRVLKRSAGSCLLAHRRHWARLNRHARAA